MTSRLIATAALVAACSTAAIAARQARERDTSWTAPARAAATSNPFSGRDDLVPGGRRLFDDRCSTCHAQDGRGTDKAPDLIDPAVQAQADGVLFWKITTGNTHEGMPTFSFLPKAQRWQLVLYVRALASH